MYGFIQQRCIELIKSDSIDIRNVAEVENVLFVH